MEPQRTHPVHVVHRVGAGALGIGLWMFAGLGFAGGLPFFSTRGAVVLGLSSNGLLSTISLLAGAVLLASAWRGPVASTATAVMGGLFLLSGLVHLAILHTPLNILAFRLSNVFFSLVAGLVLLFIGVYGRITGGLAPDNPYRRRREQQRPRTRRTESVRRDDPREERALLEAELAMAEGHPTADQQSLVETELCRLRAQERGEIEHRVRGGEERNSRGQAASGPR